MNIENTEPKLVIKDVRFDNEVPYMDGQILDEAQYCMITSTKYNINNIKEAEEFIEEFL